MSRKIFHSAVVAVLFTLPAATIAANSGNSRPYSMQVVSSPSLGPGLPFPKLGKKTPPTTGITIAGPGLPFPKLGKKTPPTTGVLVAGPGLPFPKLGKKNPPTTGPSVAGPGLPFPKLGKKTPPATGFQLSV